LGYTRIQDADLAHLAPCKSLTVLNLGNTPVTAAGIEHLASLGLHNLNLGTTSITDAAIPALAELRTLTTLYLNTTKITNEGVERLHAALPKCRIVSDFGTFAPVVDRSSPP
jgi:hypothetical protein